MAEFRTFHDISGKFSAEATFLGVVGGKVRLRKSTGEIISVPLDKLSPRDQQWVAQSAARLTGDSDVKQNGSGPAGSGDAPSSASQGVSRPAKGATNKRIDYSLSFLAEARKCLAEIKNPTEATLLTADIEASEKTLKLLARLNKEGIGPLRDYLQENRADYSSRWAWVRALRAVDLPEAAEELATETPANLVLPSILRPTEAFPLWCVGRCFLNLGEREAALRVLAQAAKLPGMVSVQIDGRLSDDSLLFLAFPGTSDVEGLMFVSKSLKNPGDRFSVLLAAARRCEDDGKREKAKEILATAPSAIDTIASSIPAALRCHATALCWTRVSVAYFKLDPKKCNELAERALDEARIIRNAQVAANAAVMLAGNNIATLAGALPNLERSREILKRVVQGFRDGDDLAHARIAFQLYRDAGEKGLPKDQAESRAAARHSNLPVGESTSNRRKS